jgi:hypothetical protein
VARATPTLARPGNLYFPRCLATAAKSSSTKKLPLAGVRVLDMSRILAGVCGMINWPLATLYGGMLIVGIAILHADSW